MSALRSSLSRLADEFAAGVLEAIRAASLEEILAESAGPKERGRGRERARTAPAAAPAGPARGGARGSARGRRGRLSRRTADDIASFVSRILSALQAAPDGLRAEQIRDELGVLAKELPRPLAEAVASGKVVKRGQKRATTYFLKGGASRAAGKPARPGKRTKRGSSRKSAKKAAGGDGQG